MKEKGPNLGNVIVGTGVIPGALVGFAAFGAGAHNGAALYRVPGDL